METAMICYTSGTFIYNELIKSHMGEFFSCILEYIVIVTHFLQYQRNERQPHLFPLFHGVIYLGLQTHCKYVQSLPRSIPGKKYTWILSEWSRCNHTFIRLIFVLNIEIMLVFTLICFSQLRNVVLFFPRRSYFKLFFYFVVGLGSLKGFIFFQ